MTQEEMFIARFEKRHPDIVELIKEWETWSLDQDWDNLKILLNVSTVPKCPEDKYDETIQFNKRYLFFKELTREVQEYLIYKNGYEKVGFTYPATVKCPDEKMRSGHVVTAYISNDNPQTK